MKNIKLFNKILLSSVIIFIIALLILFILGRIEREGYLSDFYINTDDTLELNNIDIENTKKLFSTGDKLDYSSLTNYIFTNSNISKYSYNFRISYYSKVFRNSDIYGVYLIKSSLPDYIKEIKINEKGSPFGLLISSVKINDDKIDNIKYILKLKPKLLYTVLFYIIILYIVVLIFVKYLFVMITNITKPILVLMIFFCFLILPNFIYTIFYNKFDHTNYEYRTFAENPIFNLYNINDYPKKYEDYFNDHLAFKNELVKLKNMTDILLFKNILSKDIILGKDKWLFYNYNNLLEQYIGLNNYKFDDEKLKIVKDNLIYMNDKLEKKGIEFILMICPDKLFIYPEYMPDYIKRKDILSPSDYLVKYLRTNTNLKIVYPKEQLLNYKKKYQLYYKYDSHWNNLGGYVGYMELAKKLNLDYRNIDYFSNNIILSQNGDVGLDLARTLSLSKTKYYNDYKYYIIDNGFQSDIKDHGGNIFYISSNTNAIDKTILFLRDSYSIAVSPYITSNYKTNIFLTYHLLNDETLNSLKNYKIDIVIFETVNRAILTRFNHKYDILLDCINK